MLDNVLFWRLNQAFLCGLYLAGAALFATGHTHHLLVLLVIGILLVHVLEIPLAMRMLEGRDFAVGRLVAGTLIFGFYWWVPARRGLLPIK